MRGLQWRRSERPLAASPTEIQFKNGVRWKRARDRSILFETDGDFPVGRTDLNVTIVPRKAKCGESAIGEVTLGAGGPH